jgi:ribosomal protein RSM22 (predicted rRNA methylase)
LKRRPHSRIHAGLTRERGLIGTPYLGDAQLRSEYEAEIAPRTRAALARILTQLGPRLGGVQRVLDLGAGTGAAGAAVKQYLRALGTDVTVVSVDQVEALPGVIVADLRRDVRPRGVEGKFDLIVAAHVLNELGAKMTVVQRASLVFAWARELLADGGLLLLLEPALRETGRGLLGVRDRMIEAGYAVVAPCFWQGPCPALVRERDWCHDSAPWLATEDDGGAVGDPHAQGQGKARSRVDYAYVVLTRAADRLTDKRLFRIVSDPIEEKGRLRLYGCGPAGRHALVRLDRERADDNRDFDRAERGDVVVISTVETAGDGLRVTGGSRVDLRSR